MTITDRRAGIIEGLGMKAPVRAATTANITLTGEQTIDGVSVTEDMRVLVKDQSTASQNGIYVCNAGAWTRATDADGSYDLTGGSAVFALAGTVNAATLFYISSPVGAVTVGTDSITWSSTFAFSTNATLSPPSNDGAALGTTLLNWSDMFLASGGVVNWNNGDVTVTHAANTLTFGGATSGYRFDAAVLPATSDGAALGSATLMWSDLYLASEAIINWDNSDTTLVHQAADYLMLSGFTNTGSVGLNLESAAGAFLQLTDSGVKDWSIGVGDGTSAFSIFEDRAPGSAGNERLRITAGGNLTVWNGSITAHSATAVPAGGTAGAGLLVSSTANLGLFFGSGLPTLSAAKGSLYMRTDGSSSSTRLYVNTDGGTTWTNVTTAT